VKAIDGGAGLGHFEPAAQVVNRNTRGDGFLPERGRTEIVKRIGAEPVIAKRDAPQFLEEVMVLRVFGNGGLEHLAVDIGVHRPYALYGDINTECLWRRFPTGPWAIGLVVVLDTECSAGKLYPLFTP
jgi:hypothetical protein